MKKRIFITFGDDKFAESRDYAAKMAKRWGGFDKVIVYTPNDIDEDFKKEHEDIFCIKRGYGLWLWKPYLIYKTLNEEAKDGDMLFYGDGGAFFMRSIRYIEKSLGDDDIWVSCVPLCEWQFTKADAFELLSCKDVDYKMTAQAQGGFLYIRKTQDSMSFIKKWLDACCDLRLLHPDNIALGLENPVGFHGHREDQSILSLLCKKHGIKLHQDPTQFGKYPERYWVKGFDKAPYMGKREYPVSIILHRSRTILKKSFINQIILSLIPKRIGLKLLKIG